MKTINENQNKKQSESQNSLIINYMKKGNSITALEAQRKFKCMRLASRINNLKNMGFIIKSEFIIVPSGKRVKKYFI